MIEFMNSFNNRILEVHKMLENIIKTVKIGIITGSLAVCNYGCSTLSKDVKIKSPALNHIAEMQRDLECYENDINNKYCATKNYPLIIFEYR
jgi:hypothetical protein